MFGKEGTKKVDTTCRFKGKSLLGVKEKKKKEMVEGNNHLL